MARRRQARKRAPLRSLLHQRPPLGFRRRRRRKIGTQDDGEGPVVRPGGLRMRRKQMSMTRTLETMEPVPQVRRHRAFRSGSAPCSSDTVEVDVVACRCTSSILNDTSGDADFRNDYCDICDTFRGSNLITAQNSNPMFTQIEVSLVCAQSKASSSRHSCVREQSLQTTLTTRRKSVSNAPRALMQACTLQETLSP